MIDFVDEIRSKIEGMNVKIVYPESFDPRVIKAIGMLKREKINVSFILLGDKDKINGIAKENGVDISDCTIINPSTSEYMDEFIEEFYELRKHKGVSKDQCADYMRNDINAFGAMLVRKGIADCMVSGSMSPTADVIRAAIWIVKTKKNVTTVSSSFLMVSSDPNIGSDGRVVFSDCALVVDPTPEQLADITINAVNFAKNFLNDYPRVALLSYSTRGSGSGPSVDKVKKAVELLKERNVDFEFDGELQFDAAFSEEVAKIKCPDSKVAGKANVFIFPNLDAGNIGYKIAQRIGKMKAFGPLLEGLNKPVNDLSRGCSAEDIYVTSLMTFLQTSAK
jgi:phosphate acetyltransferase